MFAFVSQAVTGVFLAMYYEPDPARAYESAAHITNEVFLGELVRGMHRWGSTVMIILIFLHMGRTFVFGAYKYPRELNWIIGVVLLVLTLSWASPATCCRSTSAPSGPRSWRVNINASGPIMGPYLADFLRGGAEFGADHAQPLLRAAHAARPGADRRADRRAPLPGGQARHHRAAVAEGREEGAREGRDLGEPAREGAVPPRVLDPEERRGSRSSPTRSPRTARWRAITLVVIILMAVLFGAELGPKADPTTTTYTPRPEWYFFFLFELLRVVKPPELVFLATIGIPTICLVLLLLLPFYRPRPGAPPAAAPDRDGRPPSRRSARWPT